MTQSKYTSIQPVLTESLDVRLTCLMELISNVPSVMSKGTLHSIRLLNVNASSHPTKPCRISAEQVNIGVFTFVGTVTSVRGSSVMITTRSEETDAAMSVKYKGTLHVSTTSHRYQCVNTTSHLN